MIRFSTMNASNFWRCSCSSSWKQMGLLRSLALIAMNKCFSTLCLGCWNDLSIWKSPSWLTITSQKWWSGLILSCKHTKRKRNAQIIEPRSILLMPFLPIKPRLTQQITKWNCINPWLICPKNWPAPSLTMNFPDLPPKKLLGRIHRETNRIFLRMWSKNASQSWKNKYKRYPSPFKESLSWNAQKLLAEILFPQRERLGNESVIMYDLCPSWRRKQLTI